MKKVYKVFNYFIKVKTNPKKERVKIKFTGSKIFKAEKINIRKTKEEKNKEYFLFFRIKFNIKKILRVIIEIKSKIIKKLKGGI